MTKTKTNPRLSVADLHKTADRYAAILELIQLLEAEARPLREAIVEHCRDLDISGTLDLDSLLVVAQARRKQTLDQQAVTPDWLYRFQSQGGRLSVKLDADANPTADMAALLREVHYCETATQSYQLKLKP